MDLYISSFKQALLKQKDFNIVISLNGHNYKKFEKVKNYSSYDLFDVGFDNSEILYPDIKNVFDNITFFVKNSYSIFSHEYMRFFDPVSIDEMRIIQKRGPILIHCEAGMSRAPAIAYFIQCWKHPELDEIEIANKLRECSEYVMPNINIIRQADEYLDRNGLMIEAIKQLKPRKVFDDYKIIEDNFFQYNI